MYSSAHFGVGLLPLAIEHSYMYMYINWILKSAPVTEDMQIIMSEGSAVVWTFLVGQNSEFYKHSNVKAKRNNMVKMKFSKNLQKTCADFLACGKFPDCSKNGVKQKIYGHFFLLMYYMYVRADRVLAVTQHMHPVCLAIFTSINW